MSDPVVLLSTGDVVGPAGGVTNDSMVLFSGTSGKLIKGNNAVVTAAGLALLDDIDAAAQLVTLGIPKLTRAQFADDQEFATNEFVQRALGSWSGQSSYTVNTTLTAADAGKRIICGGTPITLTLPLLSAVPAGARIIIRTPAVVVTVARQGADTISLLNGSIVNSVALPINSYCVVVAGNSQWNLEEGDTSLKYSTLFASSLAANGYQKLPSGLIIQWIHTTTLGTQGATSTWPIAFPNSCLFAGVFCQNGPSPQTVSLGAKTNTTIGAYAGTVPVNIGFIGIGY